MIVGLTMINKCSKYESVHCDTRDDQLTQDMYIYITIICYSHEIISLPLFTWRLRIADYYLRYLIRRSRIAI